MVDLMIMLPQDGRNTDGAQDSVQNGEAQKDGQEERAWEEDVWQYQVRKRRVTGDENDDSEAFRAQLRPEGRKQKAKGEEQRLEAYNIYAILL